MVLNEQGFRKQVLTTLIETIDTLSRRRRELRRRDLAEALAQTSALIETVAPWVGGLQPSDRR